MCRVGSRRSLTSRSRFLEPDCQFFQRTLSILIARLERQNLKRSQTNCFPAVNLTEVHSLEQTASRLTALLSIRSDKDESAPVWSCELDFESLWGPSAGSNCRSLVVVNQVSIVALGNVEGGNEQSHAFQLSLIRDPMYGWNGNTDSAGNVFFTDGCT